MSIPPPPVEERDTKRHHRAERPRERTERTERTERSERGERERGGGGERERDREQRTERDRTDRGDRERGDRDRGDRDRERERERRHRDRHHSSRSGEQHRPRTNDNEAGETSNKEEQQDPQAERRNEDARHRERDSERYSHERTERDRGGERERSSKSHADMNGGDRERHAAVKGEEYPQGRGRDGHERDVHSRGERSDRRDSRPERDERERSHNPDQGDESRKRRHSEAQNAGGHESEVKREQSPSSKRPALESTVIPISKRERKVHMWDVAPRGFEGMTALQVKNSGAFILPGTSNRSNAGMPPGILAPGMMLASMGANNIPGPDGTTPAQQMIRQARRLYVGNIPPTLQEDDFGVFVRKAMEEADLIIGEGNPVVAVQVNHEKNYAFVEFRSSEEATAAIALDNTTYEGMQLKIRRPKDYQAIPGDMMSAPYIPGVISTSVPDSPNKLFIGGLPAYLNEEQVIELLKSFGELRAFNLVKDSATGLSKGFGFCEYIDTAATDAAIDGLHDMELVDKKLIVQRASMGQARMMGSDGQPVGLQIPLIMPTKVLMLLNMVQRDDLLDEEEYNDIKEDVQEECTRFGMVVRLVIPKPHPEDASQDVPAVGKIYVEYKSVEQATAATNGLSGRKFGENIVIVSFYDEERFHNDDLD